MAKHTQLYDYKAKEPVLLGGTHSQFSTDDGVTWLPLKGAQELGDIGDIAESVECTTIDDDRKVYCGGLKDSAEKELTIYYYDDDADQQALIAAAEAQQTVRIRHQWPNGTRAIRLCPALLTALCSLRFPADRLQMLSGQMPM